MATEPERPIEKLLQAYARKRREEAGATPELHPATRQLLQGEVKRQFAAQQSAHWSLADLIGRWGPKLAWGVGLCGMLVVVSMLLIPGSGEGSKETLLAKHEDTSRSLSTAADGPLTAPPVAAPEMEQRDLAVALTDVPQTTLREEPLQDSAAGIEWESKEAAPAEGLTAAQQAPTREQETDALRPEPLSRPTSQPSEIASTRRYGLAPTRTSSADAQTAVTPPPPASSPLTAASPQAPSSSTELGATFSGSAGQPSLGGASPAASFPARKDRALTLASVPEPSRVAQISQRFSQTKSLPRGDTGTAAALKPTDHVLVSFQMEQIGSEVRIIDGDGSVYTGDVQVEKALGRSRTVNLESPKATQSARGEARAGLRGEASPVTGSGLPQAYSFRVTGTNLTTKQNVVFSGSLIQLTGGTLTTSVANGPGNATTLANSQSPPAKQVTPPALPLSSSQIQGKLRLGDGSEVDVQALPAGN